MLSPIRSRRFAILALPLWMLPQLAAQPKPGQPNPLAQIEWQLGPTVAHIGTQAQIRVPAGYRFSGAEGTRQFLEFNQNVPSGKELGLLLPNNATWFVVFSFDDVGYVKDDEKNSLDADSLLSSIKENTERTNELRREKGWETVSVVGWIQSPHYDELTHNLEWSLRAQGEKGGMAANYDTRYLGRRGVMRVKVVTDPERLDTVLAGFRQVMGGFRYTPDNDYRAFVKGDKVAEYGLTALVVGGAAAAAAKVGLFKGLWKLALAGWKFILAAFAAIGAWLKRLFGRGEKAPAETPSEQSLA
jgi:uncharacterized membrane-anchored protein